MSRYIDAEWLMRDINNSIDGMTTVGFTVDAEYLWGKLHDALEYAPSIDIVCCGECAKRRKNKFCLKHMRYEKNDNGFCSYGEREGE